jgi:Na+-driven multidrug efflux pump
MQSNNNSNNYGNYNYNPSPASVLPQIPDYKVQSILLIVFGAITCCFSCFSIISLAFAIVALVNSNKISTHLAAGNPDLAQEYSKKTKMWCWVSFGILIAGVILSVVYFVYLFSTGMYQDLMDQIMDFQYQYDFRN